jgi:hypothetical protein
VQLIISMYSDMLQELIYWRQYGYAQSLIAVAVVFHCITLTYYLIYVYTNSFCLQQTELLLLRMKRKIMIEI